MSDGWFKTTVGEYSPFVYGKAIKKDDQRTMGIPVYGSNGIYTYSDSTLVQQHAVIIGRKGSVGKVHLSTEKCWISDTAFYVIKDSLDESYFVYYLLSSLGLENMNTDAAVPGLNRDNAHRLEIKIPNSIEKRINLVEPLIKLDQKIHLNNQINQTLESIAQAIFKSWFIDFDPVRAKIAAKLEGKNPELAAMCAISGKSEAELEQMAKEDFAELQDTAALFPDEFVDGELGEVPKGWLPVNIEYFIELIYGKALKKTERIHGVYPVYGSGGLTGWHNKALVKGPGVIIGRKGTIGSIFLENKDFYPIDTTYYVKTKNNCSLLFAYYLLQTLGLEKMNTDAAVPGLNRQNFYHLEVPFYSSDLIEKYTKTIENIISKNLSIKKENEYLIGMRDSLLPKLLSGEVALGDVIDG